METNFVKKENIPEGYENEDIPEKNAVSLNWSRIKVKKFEDGHSMVTSLVVLMLTVYNV